MVWAVAGMIGSMIGGVPASGASTLGFDIDARSAAPDAPVTVLVLDELTAAPLQGVKLSWGTWSAAEDRVRSSRRGQARLRLRSNALTVLRAEKPGYATTVLAGILSGKVTLRMKRAEDGPRVELSGRFQDWFRRSSVGHVQAGITLPPLNAAELIAFDERGVVSPHRDVIRVFGERKIPSNVMIPQQDLFLPVGGVSLDKPNYRMPVPADVDTRLIAFQGEIRALDILPAYQPGGGLSLALLNQMKIQRVSVTTPFVSRTDQRVLLDQGQALVAKHEVTVSRPPFTADVLVASAVDLDGDRLALLPTDVKLAVDSAKFNAPIVARALATTATEVGASRAALAVAMSNGGRRLSAVVKALDATRAVQMPAFWDVPAPSSFTSLPESVVLEPTPQGVTTLVLGSNAVGDGKTTQPQWVVHVLPSAGRVEVPVARLATAAPVNHYSVTRLEFAHGFDEAGIDARRQFRNLTRLTRAVSKRAAAH